MKKILLFAFGLTLFLQACQKDPVSIDSKGAASFGHEVPTTWNNMYLEMERYTAGYRPPVSARAIALVNFSAYHAIVHGSNEKYRSFSGYYPGLNLETPDPAEEYDWEVALNAAYERAFELYFPTAPAEHQLNMYEMAHIMRTKMQDKTTNEVYQRSTEYGKKIAEAVYEWSATDNWGHEAYLRNQDPSYVPPQGPDKWQPTYPDYLPGLLPFWGKVRTFAADGSDVVPPPPAFGTDPASQWYKEAQVTQKLVRDIRAGQKGDEYWIAQYWSDDCPILTFTPAARMISITNQIIAIERPNMLETVVAFAKVSMAISDAGVKCWQEKYRYNTIRPIDYIRKYMGDSDWNTVMCPDGSGGFYTPNFPSYPSGHATFSGAAAMVLSDIFGTNYQFTDRCHETRTEFNGKPRSFRSFGEMAIENAYSRVPLGVHFEFDSRAGTQLGFGIGLKVNHLPWQ